MNADEAAYNGENSNEGADNDENSNEGANNDENSNEGANNGKNSNGGACNGENSNEGACNGENSNEGACNGENSNERAYNDDIAPEELNDLLESLPFYFEMFFMDFDNYDQLQERFDTVQAEYSAGLIPPLKYVKEMQYLCSGCPFLLEHFNDLVNPRILMMCTPIADRTGYSALDPVKRNYDGDNSNEGAYNGENSNEGAYNGENSNEGANNVENSNEGAYNGENSNEGVYNNDIAPEELNDHLENLSFYFEMIFMDDDNYDQLQRFDTVNAEYAAGLISPLKYVKEMQYICSGYPGLLEYYNGLVNPRILAMCTPIADRTGSPALDPVKRNYDDAAPNFTIDYEQIQNILAAERVLDRFKSKMESKNVSSVSEPSKVSRRKRRVVKCKKRSSSGSASETTDVKSFRRLMRRELERSLNISADKPDLDQSMVSDTTEPNEVISEVCDNDKNAFLFYGFIICLLVVIMVLLLII